MGLELVSLDAETELCCWTKKINRRLYFLSYYKLEMSQVLKQVDFVLLQL